ncbi:MAG: DUF4041 domain-containing protein [Roseburia sp.]|nr:DUF4041 domain-containing protein [Roseburia sp.]
MKETVSNALKSKFYLHTWFIGVFFALTGIYPVFGIIAVILTIWQYKVWQKQTEKYGTFDELTEKISTLQNSYEKLTGDLAQEYEDAKQELSLLRSELLTAHYDFSEYDTLNSEDCKNRLAMLKEQEKDLIKSDKAVLVTSNSPKKTINDNVKQILRCFNSECDNILMNISTKNIDSMRNKITKSYETLNKIFSVDGISIQKKLLEYKLEELNLIYTAEIKREQERELQKAIKEQMIEEEKVRREIEAQKAKIEKDQTQCSNEINKLMSYMQKSQNDAEKQLYIDKIKELEDKLKELEASKETVLEREANAKAGFVYVISNIGSFGDGIYKIGMTRRLEPMDRIKELSSASVPFEFDVHAMIFADDAPALETILHQHFEKQSVNRINLRKEFFKVTLDEIEAFVKNNFNNTVEFTKIPLATEYRQTLDILSAEKAS